MLHQFYSWQIWVRMLTVDLARSGRVLALQQGSGCANLLAEAYGEGVAPRMAAMLEWDAGETSVWMQPALEKRGGRRHYGQIAA